MSPIFLLIGVTAFVINFFGATLVDSFKSVVFPQPPPRIISEVEQKVVPSPDSSSVLGFKFNLKSYNQLVESAKIDLGNKKDDFAGFNVLMPCCGYKMTVAKFEDNCQCGHHLATYGLIKKMLLAGNFSRSDIQKETDRWIAYFFPKEAIAASLKKENKWTPQVEGALKSYKTKGGC